MRDRKSDTHRKVAEARAGRKLDTNEIVHHKDENKDNNAETNLSVDARGAHTAEHNRTRHVSRLRKSLRMHAKGEKLY